MQNKGFVKVFAVLLTLVCLFYLSFTFVTGREDKKVEEWANEQTQSWVAQHEADGTPVSDSDKAEFFKEKKNEYLENHKDDKVWLGIYTLQECRELEIGLGLDLKGGLSVTLEVSAPEFLQSLTAGSKTPEVQAALATAQKVAESGADAATVVDAFVKALPTKDNDTYLSRVFATSALRDKVKNKKNEQVIEIIRSELASAVDNSYDVVRSRVDRFGVAQPNIQKLGGGQGRILVELPGVEDKERVISLLTRSSNLQFWETCSKQ